MRNKPRAPKARESAGGERRAKRVFRRRRKRFCEAKPKVSVLKNSTALQCIKKLHCLDVPFCFLFANFLVPKSPNLGCFKAVIQQKQERTVTMVTDKCWILYAILQQWDQVPFTSQSLRKIYEMVCPKVCQPRKNLLKNLHYWHFNLFTFLCFIKLVIVNINNTTVFQVCFPKKQHYVHCADVIKIYWNQFQCP